MRGVLLEEDWDRVWEFRRVGMVIREREAMLPVTRDVSI